MEEASRLEYLVIGDDPRWREALCALRVSCLRPAGFGDGTLPGDQDATTRHVVALASNVLAGAVSIMAETSVHDPAVRWRLRALAVAPSWRQCGVAEALVRRALGVCGAPVWATVRVGVSEHLARRLGAVVVSVPRCSASVWYDGLVVDVVHSGHLEA